MNKNLQKVEQFCSLDTAAAEDISDDSDKDSQINSYRPEEKWHKKTPKTGLKKGKYLCPSAKKLNFNPELSKEPQKKSKEHNYDSSGTFTRKEIKRMWNTLDVVEGETYNNEYGCKLECQPVMTEQTLPKPGQADEHSDKIRKKEQKMIAMKNQTCCICRQARCANTIECSLCQENFHRDCINFSENLARSGETNYFCTNCIYINYIPFLKYVLSSSNIYDNDLQNSMMVQLYDKFCCLDRVSTTPSPKNVDVFSEETADL